MRCTMCGYEFPEDRLACHVSCPLSSSCAVICCPRCGYSTVDPERTKLSRWFGKLFGQARKPNAGKANSDALTPSVLCLLDLKTGQDAQVVEIIESDPEYLARLSQYGLLPGTQIQICQKRPVPIVRIGATELALDLAVASRIYVIIAL